MTLIIWVVATAIGGVFVFILVRLFQATLDALAFVVDLLVPI